MKTKLRDLTKPLSETPLKNLKSIKDNMIKKSKSMNNSYGSK